MKKFGVVVMKLGDKVKVMPSYATRTRGTRT
jgi:hypothetical protein